MSFNIFDGFAFQHELMRQNEYSDLKEIVLQTPITKLTKRMLEARAERIYHTSDTERFLKDLKKVARAITKIDKTRADHILELFP